MKSWLVLFTIGFTSWHFTDVTASSPMHSLVAPLILTAIVIIAVCKIMAAVLPKGSRGPVSGDGGSSGFGSSNDGGGGDGGCGGGD